MSQHELQRLNPSHYQIINLCLEGYSVKDIALAVGLTPQAVSLITKSPNFQHELARRRESVEKKVDSELASTVSKAREKLDSLAEKAVDTIGGLLDDEDHGIQLKASKDILSMVFGDSSTPRTQVFVLDNNALENLRKTFEEVSGKTIDVIPTADSSEFQNAALTETKQG